MYQPFDIRFGGGLNNKDESFSIRDAQSSDCQNIIYDESSAIETRPGYATYGNDSGNNAILGMGKYYYQSGGSTTRSLYRAVDTDIEKYVGGTWTSQGLTLTAASGEFVQANNEVYYMNGTEAWQNLSNTTWSVLGGGAPKNNSGDISRYGTFRNGLMYVAGTDNNPSRVYISGDEDGSLDTPEDFSGGWSYDIDKDGPTGKVTGLAKAGQYTVVFKEFGTFLLTGPTGSQQTQIPVSFEIGAASQRSIATFGDRIIIFQASDGHVYGFDTNRLVKFSDAIQGTVDGMNLSKLTESNSAIHDYKGRKYILNYASGASTTPNATLVLDLERSSLFSEDANDYVWIPWSGLASSVMVTYSADGSEEDLYFGEATADSLTYLMYSGTDDNGTAIDAYWVTKSYDFEQPARYKKYKDLEIIAKAVGDWSVNIDYAIDGGELAPTTPGAINTASSGLTFPFDFPGTFEESFLATKSTVVVPAQSRFIKFRFRNNTADQTFHIYQAVLRLRLHKTRKYYA